MRPHRFIVWLLPLLLLGAQCLALAHGLLHPSGAARLTPPASQVVNAAGNIAVDISADVAAPSEAAETADAFFGHHHDAHACQLYAHWAGGDVAWPSVLALAWATNEPPVLLAYAHYRDWVAPFAAHFSARAPPLIG